jgi:hypothetical protein
MSAPSGHVGHACSNCCLNKSSPASRYSSPGSLSLCLASFPATTLHTELHFPRRPDAPPLPLALAMEGVQEKSARAEAGTGCRCARPLMIFRSRSVPDRPIALSPLTWTRRKTTRPGFGADFGQAKMADMEWSATSIPTTQHSRPINTIVTLNNTVRPRQRCARSNTQPVTAQTYDSSKMSVTRPDGSHGGMSGWNVEPGRLG